MATVERERVQTEVTVREVLHRAADLLETGEWEWGQDAARKGDALCMLGAVSAALGVVPSGRAISIDDPRYEAACRVLKRHVPTLASWNDHPWRTKDEVVAKLRRAAEAA